MSMEMTAWNSLYHAMHQQEGRGFSRETLRRILRFARPHRGELRAYLALGVVAAVLAVATPILAGRVVDAIDQGRDSSVVIGLAVVIAIIAVLEAGVSMVNRWLSARIGEGLILDLRRAVFSHVQRMPVAFFTRTRTGALVSRLDNDVIGAQRAFSDTLSGVVTNIVTLVLTLGVMLGLSWQVTLLSLVLLPLFVIPTRRAGITNNGSRTSDRSGSRRRAPRWSSCSAGPTTRPGRSPTAPSGCATSACVRRWRSSAS